MLKKRFGLLTVISELPQRDINGHKRWVCKCDCGSRRVVYGHNLKSGSTKSCGCLPKNYVHLRGSYHPRWKGGRRVDKDGYVWLYNQHTQKYRQEHILKMEDRLGRALLPGETVHHKNGIRSENQDDNLELRIKAKHPAGASIDDLLAWADELIARYRR